MVVVHISGTAHNIRLVRCSRRQIENKNIIRRHNETTQLQSIVVAADWLLHWNFLVSQCTRISLGPVIQ